MGRAEDIVHRRQEAELRQYKARQARENQESDRLFRTELAPLGPLLARELDRLRWPAALIVTVVELNPERRKCIATRKIRGQEILIGSDGKFYHQLAHHCDSHGGLSDWQWTEITGNFDLASMRSMVSSVRASLTRARAM